MLMIAVAPAAALSQGCQTPLFVQEGAVDANVMILFDNSGSMNEVMFHPDYDPFYEYDGGFSTDRTYYIRDTGDYTPREVPGRPSGMPNSPSAYLVSSYNQKGRYRGNYLNWVYFNASEEQRAAIPTETRIQVAKLVVSDIIDRSNSVRFGLTIFNYSSGGQILEGCGADKSDLINTINFDIEGNSWTPLGESMEDILEYFDRTDDNAPIQAWCQHNFLIVMTDGYPTKDVEVSWYLHDADEDGNDPGNCESIGAPGYSNSYDCSDHMDDVAYWLRNTDLRPDLGEPGEDGIDGQNVVTYTIGFALDAPLLEETAMNGDGLYLVAEDASELWLSLELIMLDIISRISSGAAVAVVSTERSDEDRLFRGKFMPGSWTGFLEAFELPYEDGDSPIWEAGHLLSDRSADNRRIFTVVDDQEYDFTPGEAGEFNSAMEIDDVGEAADVIAWTRGENVMGYRDREDWKLGDIIHSTPVVIGDPAEFYIDESYMEFRENHAGREKLVYVGGNDGMLHAFRAENGHESWAFVPEFALSKLAAIADQTYCHQYSVDLTPSAKDVKYGGDWHTVLVGGGREGGAHYFAIDVTYPDSPQVLWQQTLDHDVPFSSEAEFASIGDQAVVIFGSGLDAAGGEAWIFVYDVDDGELAGAMQLSDNGGWRRNKATAMRVVDRELDGEDDVGYMGDLEGTVWRFEFNGSTNPNHWSRTALFSGDREITAPPEPAYGEGELVYVYFGTGAYLETDDITTLDSNAFYCVYDRHDGAENPSLVDQTDGIHDIGDADGWFMTLQEAAGERVTQSAAIVAGTTFFTSFAPSAEPCEAGGRSWLYRVAYDDGSVPDDGEEDAFDGGRVIALDEGVASQPVIDIVNETVIVQSSDATITVEDIGQTYFHLTVRSWQETFDHVEEIQLP